MDSPSSGQIVILALEVTLQPQPRQVIVLGRRHQVRQVHLPEVQALPNLSGAVTEHLTTVQLEALLLGVLVG